MATDAQRIEQIYLILERSYPGVQSRLLEPTRGNPVDVLVATILSQATNDNLSSRAYDNLKGLCPVWEDALLAETGKIEEALAIGGLHRQKTKKLRSALARLAQDFGAITLQPLERLTPKEIYEYLTALPGVGPKTAACVMAFGLDLPAFPVDTHVLRLSKRLGLVPQKSGAAKAQEILEAATPPSIKMPLHLALIQHGREVCFARNPRCKGCVLADICPSAMPEAPKGVLSTSQELDPR